MDGSQRIAVIGAGSWGTALAQLLAEKGYGVDLWVYEPELCETIRRTRENDYYLKGFRLSDNIAPSTDLAGTVRDHSMLVMVVPSHVYRSVASLMVPHLKKGCILVSATMGI